MHEKSDTKFCNCPHFPLLSIDLMQKLTFFIKTNLIILKKSFKWGTVGFFSVSESKVIEKSKKKVKQEVVQFLPTKIVQKKSTCVWRSVYQKL